MKMEEIMRRKVVLTSASFAGMVRNSGYIEEKSDYREIFLCNKGEWKGRRWILQLEKGRRLLR